MSKYQVSLVVDQSEYKAAADDKTTLLEVMRDARLPVRKACRNGACGICRCRLSAGDITYHQREPFGLWERDIKAGYILPCIAYATSDLTLEELTLEPV